jgi:predicted PurR-regulated permease PerM
MSPQSSKYSRKAWMRQWVKWVAPFVGLLLLLVMVGDAVYFLAPYTDLVVLSLIVGIVANIVMSAAAVGGLYIAARQQK